jgi:hypothetical protein
MHAASQISETPEQIFERTKAREIRLSRLLVFDITGGLLFMLLPGTFLGVWNLAFISGRHAAESISLFRRPKKALVLASKANIKPSNFGLPAAQATCRSSGKCRRIAVGSADFGSSDGSVCAASLSARAVTTSLIGLICLAADIRKLVSRGMGQDFRLPRSRLGTDHAVRISHQLHVCHSSRNGPCEQFGSNPRA